MKKILSAIFLLIPTLILGQDFEGEIIYGLSYHRLDNGEEIKDENLKIILGKRSTFLTKGGLNKQITDSKFLSLQVYSRNESRYYFKDSSTSDTLFYYDTKKYQNTPFEYDVKQKTDTILGYVCNKLVYKDSLANADYYYAPELKADPKYYKDFRVSNRNKIQEIMKSIALRFDFYLPGFIMRFKAVEIIERKIPESEFSLPTYKFLIEKNSR